MYGRIIIHIRGSGSTVERQLPKLDVAGSNPVFRSTKTHAKGALKSPLRVSFSMLKCRF